MKTVWMAMGVGLMVWLLLAGSASADSDRLGSPDFEGVYGAFIDRLIESCEIKAARSGSQMSNVCRCAARAKLKAAFCARHRDDLIEQMAEARIGVKQYKMSYFVNNRFIESLRAAGFSLDRSPGPGFSNSRQ